MSIKSLYNKHREVFWYLVVGVLTTLVNLTVYHICISTFLNHDNPVQLQISVVISWIASVAFSYIASRKLVFRSTEKNILKELTSFVIARLGTLGMDMGLRFILVSLLHWHDKLAWVIVQIIVVIANYIFSKIFVFRKTKKKIEEIKNS